MIITNRESEIILDAIEKDNPGPILELYQNGFDINLKFKDGESILHKCFARQKYNTTQYLILLGSDFNAVDENLRTPLHYASRFGFYDGCNLLLLLGAEIDSLDHMSRTPLMHAIKYNQKLIVKTLMGKGSSSDIEDSNGFSSLLWAVKFMSAENLKEFIGENKALQEKVAEQIELANPEKLEVADIIKEIVSAPEVSTAVADEKTPEAVSYLKELFSKTKNKIVQAASYSIKEHLESLKSKEQPSEFEYDRKIIDDNDDKKNNQNDKGYDPTESEFEDTVKEKNLEQKMSYSLSHPFNRKNNYSEANSSSVSEKEVEYENAPEEDLITKPISKELNKNETNKIPIEAKNREKDREETKKETTISTQIKVTKKEIREQSPTIINEIENEIESSLNSNLPTSEPEKKAATLRPSMNVNILKQDEIIRPKSNLEAKIQVKEDARQEEVNKIQSQVLEDEEIEKLLQEDIVAEIIGHESNKEQIENALDLLSGVKSEERIIHKKKVTYLRDGFSEVYKDDFGEIKKTDKKLSDDILGTLNSGNRVFKDELGEIHTTDKRIESDKEVNEIKPSNQHLTEYESLTNANAPRPVRTEREIDNDLIKVKSIPSNSEKITNTKVNRPTLNDTPLSSQSPKKPTISTKNTILDMEFESSKKNENERESESEQEFQVKSITINKNEIQNEQSDLKEKSANNLEEEESSIVTSKEVVNDQLTLEEEKILKSIIDVNQRNAKGQTLCWLASEKGQVNLLKKIIHDGADYEIKDLKGVSCLMIAAMNGHIDVIDYLSHKVRSVDEKNAEGNTALILAVDNDRADVARALINNGANIETKIKGNSLLMHASSLGNLECIKLFILLGLDPNEKNFRGKSALDLAKASKNKKAFQLLSKVMEGRGKNIRKKE